jgi:hypothetical protein
MQMYSLGGVPESSLGLPQPGGAVCPLSLASPNSTAKLLLLEKRLTSGVTPHEVPVVPAMVATAAGDSLGAADAAADMDTDDVLICNEVHPTHQLQQQQQQKTPGSNTNASASVTASASKRRKTCNPKHRPSSADQQQQDSSRATLTTPAAQGSRDATAARDRPPLTSPGAQSSRDATAARDRTPTNRGRASPLTDKAGGGPDAPAGSSNPPMSPVAGISGVF